MAPYLIGHLDPDPYKGISEKVQYLPIYINDLLLICTTFCKQRKTQINEAYQEKRFTIIYS
jgi:hypothetical protein